METPTAVLISCYYLDSCSYRVVYLRR